MAISAIAMAYARRILRGAITIDDVPARIRTQVEEALRELEGNEE